MKHEEAKLQAEIVQYLQKRGIYFFAVSNEANGRNKIQQMQMIAMGLRPGVSDMVWILPGKVVFVEVKTEDGKQSEAQKRFEAKVNELGFDYFLVRSMESVKILVDNLLQ